MFAAKVSRSALFASPMLLAARRLLASTEQRSLKDIASDRGIVFGSAVDWPDTPVLYTREISSLYAKECSVFVPSYQLLWSQNQPRSLEFSFARADSVWSFADTMKARVVGDKVVWDEFTPQWANDVYSRDGRPKAEQLLMTHVSDVVGHFRGRSASWIVVNECLDKFGGGINGLKSVPIYNTLGLSSLEIAFHAAHEADPDAELTLNEVDLELPFPGNDSKRRHMLRILEFMRKRSVPVHALGIQSHLRSQYGFDRTQIRHFISVVADLGLKVRITELDVDDRGYPTDFSARDEACARLVKDYLDCVLDEKKVDMVVIFGLIDQYSWLNLPNQPVPKMDQYDMRNLRRDGTKHRPLPYDDQLRPKAMRQALVDALAGAPSR
jgi:endo-1,4-beta-xylanase